MRFAKGLLVAVATLGTIEIAGSGTPLATVQIARADSLPAVWQRKVQKLVENINRSRQALADNGAADLKDDFKAKQWRDRLANYQSTLAKVPDSSDPLLSSAKEQLALLQQEFTALDSGSGAGTAAAESGGTSAAQPAQPATGPQLVSGQRVRMKKLARDIANLRNDLSTTGPSPLQDGTIVAKYNKRLKQIADELGRYVEYKGDPDVQAAASEYKALVAALTEENGRAQAQLKELGQPLPEILANMKATINDNPPPTPMIPPFTEEQAKGWVQQAVKAQQAGQAVVKEVERIRPLAYTTDPNLMNNYQRWGNDNVAKTNAAYDQSLETLKHRFDNQDGEHELGFFRNLDPTNDHHLANMYLKEGAEADVYERLDKHLALAESVAAFQRAVGKEPTENTKARIAEIKGLRKKYGEDRLKAIGESKLPEPKSDDPARIAAAKEILANKEYEFGEHGPIVLTTPEILTKEKEVSRDTIKDVDVSLSGTITLSGTRETWNYKWDEFKFATPLKEEDSDDWYIWWITAKKYESGWEKTPIGYWVSGAAVKGSLIPEENFR